VSDIIIFQIVVIVLVADFLDGFLDAEMDTIRYRPKESWFPLSVYWIRSNWNRELFIDCYKIVNLTILAFVNSKESWFFS